MKREKLLAFIHNLFTEKKYSSWAVGTIEVKDEWKSLIVELDKRGLDIKPLKDLGETCYSKLVYRAFDSPIKKDEGYFVIFNVAGEIWHSLIYHKNVSAKLTQGK